MTDMSNTEQHPVLAAFATKDSSFFAVDYHNPLTKLLKTLPDHICITDTVELYGGYAHAIQFDLCTSVLVRYCSHLPGVRK